MRTPQLPAPVEWTTLTAMAEVVIKSGLLPASIKTNAAALTIMLKARELAIPPLYGLSNIVVVQGKPTCSAELMLALIYRDHGDNALIVEESTSEVCRVSYRRRSWDAARSYSFTIDDAKTANLAGKDTWRQYPAAMLRARCISAVARMAYADSIAGFYTPEELGAEVTVGADGEVVVVQPLEPAPALPAPTPIRQPPDPGHGGADDDPYLTFTVPDRDPALTAAAVTGATPLTDNPAVIAGLALAAECDALAARLRAAGIVAAPLPDPRTLRALKAWHETSTATLQAHNRTIDQPPLIAEPRPTHYDAPLGRGGKGR
jgi:hypothetical protein